MMKADLNRRLLFAFGLLAICAFISEKSFRKERPLDCANTMTRATDLTKKWFSLIETFKHNAGIQSDAGSNVAYNQLIGDEWSEITTSLGSLEAKETATNPDFSALIVRLLHEAGISEHDKVGVILSGSFPSLAISVLAALQTTGADAVIMSSLGASTYGANQPKATWLDMESVLTREGGLKVHSSLVSIGAGADRGIGLSPEGVSAIRQAAYRNKSELYLPASLQESIAHRVDILQKAGISLLINIGGNETAIGNCPHTLAIPNGYHARISTCQDEERGVIVRMNELNVPVIHLLDIRNLALQYGISISPGKEYAKSTNLYVKTSSNKAAMGILLLIGLVPLCFLGKRITIKSA